MFDFFFIKENFVIYILWQGLGSLVNIYLKELIVLIKVADDGAVLKF